MSCAACGHENRPSAKFCEECGSALAGACPRCGAALRAGAQACEACAATAAPPRAAPSDYTPRHLAEKILVSRSALEGERKQVTVLFADVKGSVELSDQVDPEVWHGILDRFLQILADGVHRFEGTINQYTGDGVMALFGAPIAHEDHAQRGCYAALHLLEQLRDYGRELRREHGLDFGVRMGLNSGEVVVGKIGDDLRMDYTAHGATVGLAARMQQIAEPGRAYLTRETAALVAGYFQLEDLGEFKIRGVGVPVRAFALAGTGELRTRFDVSRARGFSRFVGRGAELAELEAALECAIAGQGQVVGVVAEAGTGKSRLCHEFLARPRARGIEVIEAHGVPHGKQIPLLPMIQLLRAVLGIRERDSDRAAREKVAGRLLLIDEELRGVLPLVFDLLGISDPGQRLPAMDPDVRQHQLFNFLRRMMQIAAGERQPAVILVEDLHWIDDASEAFLEHMIDAVEGQRLLLLLNFRPDYEVRWMDRAHYRHLPLDPLGPEEIRELLADLLGDDPSVAPLPDLIVPRTGGNPFFVEEAVRSLAEGGQLAGARGAYRLVAPVAELALPATVQAILASRIDRLVERDKRVLQTAAVIGREFAEPVLRRVAELPDPDLAGALASLERTGFVHPESLYPETEYVFNHPVIQEVAYESQLRERSAGLHAAVARALEELHPDKLDEQAALLAHHWERGGERLQSARWNARAAHRISGSNPEGARRHWRKVVALLEGASETEEAAELMIRACQNILVLSLVAGVSPDEAQVVYLRARDLAEERADVRALSFLTSIYGLVLAASTGSMKTILRHAREGSELAARTGEPFLQLVVDMDLVMALHLAGRLREARDVCRAALAPPADPELRRVYTGSVFYQHVLARDAYITGELEAPAEGVRRLGELIPWARRHDALLELNIRQWRVELMERLGDEHGAMEEARRALETAERIGAPLLQASACTALAIAHSMRGEWEAAAGACERGLEVIQHSRTGLWEQPVLLSYLAQAQAGLGELEAARATAAGALERSRQQGVHDGRFPLALARVLLAAGDTSPPDEIAATLDEAEREIGEEGREASRPLLWLERARLASAVGDAEGRERALRRAQRMFVDLGADWNAERVARELAAPGVGS